MFILYFKPSIFRCIVLRWVRMLGFAIVYGTITLKLYRWLGGSGPPQREGFGSQEPHRWKGLGVRTPTPRRVWVLGIPAAGRVWDLHNGEGWGLGTLTAGRVWVSRPPQREGFRYQESHSWKGLGAKDTHGGEGLGRPWDPHNGEGWGLTGMCWSLNGTGWGLTGMCWDLTGMG